MTGDFVDQELGFDINNIDVPLVGDAILDKVEDAPSVGQKSQGTAEKGDGQAATTQAANPTAQDIYFISDALINLPTVVWTKLPERDPEKIKTFNEQLHKYCMKKGIDPWEYFFDEFGMAMAIIPVLKSYRDDYVELYSKPKKEEVKHELDKDHEHYKEVEDKKEVIESGE